MCLVLVFTLCVGVGFHFDWFLEFVSCYVAAVAWENLLICSPLTSLLEVFHKTLLYYS